MQGLNSIAITFFPKSSRQIYLLFALGVILLLGAVLIWYGFFREPSLSVVDNQPPLPPVVEIDFTVFKTRVFQDLGALLPPIPLPEEVGKRNPFVPTD
ncbi:MAG: hypothetical protein AAB524_01340 [Patescibacteria group bacterium]